VNKKLIAGLIAVILIIPTTAQAAHNVGLSNSPVVTPTLAILDTAIDTSLPAFSGKIIQEVCIIDWSTCPNGTSFMEGPGAASMPLDFMLKNGFYHGTRMAQSALISNSNINILFIKVIGNTATGSRQIASDNNVAKALNWISLNKDKYNIQAVSMSQGHHVLLPGANYCNKSPLLEGAISTLYNFGIPVFFAAGNAKDLKRIDFPSCIHLSISVGATMPGDYIAPYSNADSLLLDFYALGSLRLFLPGGKTQVNSSGTSISTQILAGAWLKIKTNNPSFSYSDTYNYMTSKSVIVNGRGVSGKFVDYLAISNG